MSGDCCTMTNERLTIDWLVEQLRQAGIIDILSSDVSAIEQHPISALGAIQLVTTDGSLLDEDTIVRHLACVLDCRQVQLHELLPPPKCTLFPVDFLCTHMLLPLNSVDDVIEIAHANPLDLSWHMLIEHFFDMRVVPVLASPSALLRLFDSIYTMDDFIVQATQEYTEADGGLGFAGLQIQEQSSIHEIADRIVHISVRNKASDIHIEPQQGSLVRVRVRIDGVLHTIQTLPVDVAHAFMNRMKILADMDIAEHRRAQDGRFQLTVDGMAFDARVSSIPVLEGEKIVIRLLDRRIIEQTFAALGMTADIVAQWRTIIHCASGMIVIAGPTGSGKSTTLYTSLLQIGTQEKSVATIEDPIEYLVPTFSQTQVNDALGVSYAAGLKALLRQDPDIILLGEIRDAQTAHTAVQAALTGHLVFTTVHATDALGAELRLRELGISDSLLKQTVRTFAAQRLLRTLCVACTGSGCNTCRHTGYLGRTALFQLYDTSKVKQEPPRFFTLGMDLVAQGRTNEAEVQRVCLGI